MISNLPPEILVLIAQQIPTSKAALNFCTTSKQVQSLTEPIVWNRVAKDKLGNACKFADIVRIKALRDKGRVGLFRRLVTFAGVTPDMRDLALASYLDDHALADEILAHRVVNTEQQLPEDYEFQFINFRYNYLWDFIGHPLANACYLGNLAMVRKLLAIPDIGDINRVWRLPDTEKSRHGFYPENFSCAVHAASISPDPDVLQAVMDAGGDPNAVGNIEEEAPAPIILTFKYHRAQNAEILWLAGADLAPLRKKLMYVMRVAYMSKFDAWIDNWSEFIPFIVHCATTEIPVSWILSVAVESRAHKLTAALLKADPSLFRMANAFLLAYKLFKFPESRRRSFVFVAGRRLDRARAYYTKLHGRDFGSETLFQDRCFNGYGLRMK